MNLKLLKIQRFFHLISKKDYNEKRHIEIVKNSPLFDAKWYLSQNPDVKAKNMGAAKHYVKYGWKEGRNPSADFDNNAYLEKYPELEAKGWCPVFHYMLEHKELMPKVSVKEGIAEVVEKMEKELAESVEKMEKELADKCAKKGIKLKFLNKYEGKSKDYVLIAKSKYFDKKWYLKQYPDVKKAKVDPIEHYMKYGWKEGGNPSKKFDTNGYLDRYNDVKNAKVNPLLHYEKFGKKEGRSVVSVVSQKELEFRELKPNVLDNFVCKRKNKNPKISVVVASYNYQDYIKETLDSLLAQTYKNFEIIVVDDGSKDDSVKVIKKYVKKYPNVFLYRHHQGKNKGLPETVRLGIEKSTGEYIAFCEADDYWTPEHLEEKVKYIRKYANPNIIINDVILFGDENRCNVVKKIVLNRKQNLSASKSKIKVTEFRTQNWIVTFSCCMVKKCILQKCNIIDVPRKANLDWWLWRQVCCSNPIYYVNKKMTYWRMHNSYMKKEPLSSIIKQAEFLGNMDKILIKKHPFLSLPLLKYKNINNVNIETKNGKLCKKGVVLEKQPSFSVIMPTYNRAFCICDAVDSLLNQSYQNFELIIVDDGSKDNTKSVLQQKYKKELESGKIKYVYKENSGVCKTRNVGLKYAKNEWIAYLDSDNSIVGDFLAIFAKNILEHPNKRTFYAKLIVKGNKKQIGNSFNLKKLLYANYIDLGVFCHHNSVYKELGGFDENMTRLVDWELIVRYTKKYTPYFINSIVLLYNDDGDYERITNNVKLYDNYCYFRKKHCDYPIVTTMITAYNHETYIKQAIDSAIMQMGGFVHEILISDDGSTDNTPRIIEEYAEKYPHLIRNISKKENVGISENMKRCFMEAKGKYIAVLEGDDYWTDDKKIEKQMKFLEKNKDCSMVFSRINLLNKSGKFQLLDRHNGLPNKLTGNHFIKELSLIVNFSCCMFKTDLLKKLPEILYKDRLSEISLAFYLEKFGKIGFISEPLSVYRQHVNGVWSGADRRGQILSGIRCVSQALEVSKKKYHKFFNDYIENKNRELETLRDYTYYKNLSPEQYPEALAEWYKKITNKELDLKNPKTFNEKIQWMKLYDSTPLKTKLADKYLVRDWVKEKIGEEYLIPLLGVYDKFEDIDFNKLPDKFVIKCNHGSGWNIIVKDKSQLNLIDVKAKLDKWMSMNYAFVSGIELHYKDMQPKIIIEKFMDDGTGDLRDYKYTCFDGKPEFIWIDSDRHSVHKRNLYDLNWKQLDCKVNSKYDTFPSPEKPSCLEEMNKLAIILSKDFLYVRVDFYIINNKIYFGEMTFTSSSGTEDIIPACFEKELSEKIKLPKLAYNMNKGEYYNY